MILTQSGGFILGNLAKLLGWIMNGIYNLFSNMGFISIALSIIVFTIVVRLLMFPLSIRSTRSSWIQRYLQPEFTKINKKRPYLRNRSYFSLHWRDAVQYALANPGKAFAGA